MMKFFLLLLTVFTVLAAGVSIHGKVETSSNMIAAIEQANFKDLGRCLLTTTYKCLADQLGPASAASGDCVHYGLDALNSLTDVERSAIIEQCKYPASGAVSQSLASIEDYPLKGLGKKLFTTAFNFMKDKLGAVESWTCEDYALNALKSLTKAERKTVVQQAYRQAEVQARGGRVTPIGLGGQKSAAVVEGFLPNRPSIQQNGYADEEEAKEQFMSTFLPLLTGVVSKMLENNKG